MPIMPFIKQTKTIDEKGQAFFDTGTYVTEWPLFILDARSLISPTADRRPGLADFQDRKSQNLIRELSLYSVYRAKTSSSIV